MEKKSYPIPGKINNPYPKNCLTFCSILTQVYIIEAGNPIEVTVIVTSFPEAVYFPKTPRPENSPPDVSPEK